MFSSKSTEKLSEAELEIEELRKHINQLVRKSGRSSPILSSKAVKSIYAFLTAYDDLWSMQNVIELTTKLLERISKEKAEYYGVTQDFMFNKIREKMWGSWVRHWLDEHLNKTTYHVSKLTKKEQEKEEKQHRKTIGKLRERLYGDTGYYKNWKKKQTKENE